MDLYVKLMINNNSAQYGGRIFVADDTHTEECMHVEEGPQKLMIYKPFLLASFKQLTCIRWTSNHFNTFMTNNRAIQSGAVIYGGMLDRCTVDAEYPNRIGLDYIHNTVKSSINLLYAWLFMVMFYNYLQHDNVSTRKGQHN